MTHDYSQNHYGTSDTEVEELRQQLADRNQTILDHVEIQNALRQQLAAALSENQQLRTNAKRVFEQEERKADQAIAAVIFGKRSTK